MKIDGGLAIHMFSLSRCNMTASAEQVNPLGQPARSGGSPGLIGFGRLREWRWLRASAEGLLLLVVSLATFKPMLLALMGETAYRTEIEALATGTAGERVLARVMQPDWVTLAIVGLVQPPVRRQGSAGQLQRD
jgi:hypothetical protein